MPYTRLAKIIDEQDYAGILEQDGWETLCLTVNATENSEDAEKILVAFQTNVEHIMANANGAAFIVLDDKWFRVDCTINEDEEKWIYYHDEETGDETSLDLLDADDILDARTAVFYSVTRME